jgi:dye decolorizing peroxidase
MDLDAWDQLTRNEQERSIGRDLAHGAPLTGTRETDPLDLGARDDHGRLVIPLGAHARLSHPSQNAGIRIFRKAANYTDVGDRRSAGLIFLSHQVDIGAQFTPLQQRLDETDDLNTWTTAVGSAEFALLPGFTETTWLGQSLLG